MCFFLSNDKKFIISQIYDNYNGILGSIYNININNNANNTNNIFPLIKYNLLDYSYNTNNHKICITSTNDNCLLYNTDLDIIVWYKINHNLITKQKLLRILLAVDWIQQLNSLLFPISFIMKDCDYYYVYTNNNEIYYDKNINISTKPFLSCERLKSNIPHMIDFTSNKLIEF